MLVATHRVLAFLVLLLVIRVAPAQVSQGGTPLTIVAQDKLPAAPTILLPAVDVAALKAQDLVNDLNKSIPWRFGSNHAVDIGIDNAGVWAELPDGDRIWRVTVESKHALSINLEFHAFDIAPGGEVFLVNDAGQWLGAYTRENDPLGTHMLGVEPLEGDRITVEYRVPIGEKPGHLRIGQITHAYRHPFGHLKAFGSSGSCNVNSICDEATWGPQISAVAEILVGGSGYCTGSLINNCAANGTPYFMTANHCTSGQNVGTWVFRFNWESPTCTPTQNIGTSQTVSGASLLATNAGSDAALLQLNSIPPAGYNVTYLGWDKSGATPANQTCIHHPSGDIKKISHDNQSAGQATYGSAACWHIFNWDSGTTEPGSSGSCLLDQNHRYIGQLYGGTASCSNNIDDYFGRFDVSYPFLSAWLGSCGNTVDLYDPNAPTVSLDAQMTGINGFSGNSCSSAADPVAVVRNGGTTTLTSFTISWQLNGGATQNQNWNGSLGTGNSVNVSLPVQTLTPGNNTLVVTVSAPNGSTDLLPANDQANAGMSYGNTTTTLQLNLDRYGNETTWSITGPGGSTTYASGGPYVEQASNGVFPQAPITICLPNGCYELRVNDAFGDGMWGAYGNGYYTLTDAGGNMLASGGTMVNQTITSFCVPYACSNSLPYTQNFDSGLGGWLLNTTGVDFQWLQFNTATPSTNTGPDVDHTSGSGYYLYCEASTPNNPTKTAIMTSPCFDLSGYVACTMTFWRHMFGAAMGSLNVDVQVNGGAWTNGVWTLSGNQTNSWVQASVNLTPYLSSNTRVRFRGITGSGATSDAAIDDVSLTGTPGVKVNAKVWLEGPFDTGTGQMNDDLRSNGQVPTTEPYTGLGMANAAGGGAETTTPAILAVTGNNAVVDWVHMELRSSADPASLLATRNGLLQRDGDVVSAADGTSPLTFNIGAASYYVVVRHRNHLGCMTSTALGLTGSATTVDFRSAGTAVYGTEARKTVGSVQALWAGNAVRDITLKYTGTSNDRDAVLVAIGGIVPTNTVTGGYRMEDCNLDNVVKYTGTANDRDMILVNIGGIVPTNTRTEQVP